MKTLSSSHWRHAAAGRQTSQPLVAQMAGPGQPARMRSIWFCATWPSARKRRARQDCSFTRRSLNGRRCGKHPRTVLCAGGDGDTVPIIDLHSHKNEPSDLVFAEMWLETLECLLGCAAISDEGELFCPLESNSLLVRIKRRLLPGAERRHALGLFAVLQPIGCPSCRAALLP